MNFAAFLRYLGGLHDCTVDRFDWNTREKKITIEIEDIHWNYEGLEEYKGPQEGKIILVGVEAISLEVKLAQEPLFISEFSEPIPKAGRFESTIYFRGNGKIVVTFDDVIFPDIHPT